MGVISAAASLLLSAGVAFAEEGSTNAIPSVETTVANPTPTAIKAETEKTARERMKAEVAAKKAEIEKTAREAKRTREGQRKNRRLTRVKPLQLRLEQI